MNIVKVGPLATVSNGCEKFALVIPSRKRPHRVHQHPLFEYANVIVHESEVDDYSNEFDRIGRWPASLLPHQKNSYPAIANYVFAELDSPQIDWIQLTDDDFRAMLRLMTRNGKRSMEKRPDHIAAIWHQSFIVAKNLPTGIFVYASTAIPYERRAYKPFSLRSWGMAGAWGFIDRSVPFDEILNLNADLDMCLQMMVKWRFILKDNRFYGWCEETGGKMASDVGGVANQRTRAAFERAFHYLQQKWGSEVIQPGRDRGTGLTISVNLAKIS